MDQFDHLDPVWLAFSIRRDAAHLLAYKVALRCHLLPHSVQRLPPQYQVIEQGRPAQHQILVIVQGASVPDDSEVRLQSDIYFLPDWGGRKSFRSAAPLTSPGATLSANRFGRVLPMIIPIFTMFVPRSAMSASLARLPTTAEHLENRDLILSQLSVG